MYFFCQHYNHPLKITAPSKNWGPVKPPLFENLVGGSTPLHQQKRGWGGGEGVGRGGAHYVHPTEENGTTIDTKE